MQVEGKEARKEQRKGVVGMVGSGPFSCFWNGAEGGVGGEAREAGRTSPKGLRCRLRANRLEGRHWERWRVGSKKMLDPHCSGDLPGTHAAPGTLPIKASLSPEATPLALEYGEHRCYKEQTEMVPVCPSYKLPRTIT